MRDDSLNSRRKSFVKAIYSPTDLPHESEYRLAADTVFLLLEDGTARLLNMGSSFYAISATGADLLLKTFRWGSIQAIEKTSERYQIPDEQVRRDLNRFLDQLKTRRLILTEQVSEAQQRTRRITCKWLIGMLLGRSGARAYLTKARVWKLLALAKISFLLIGWSRSITLWRRHFPVVLRCEQDRHPGRTAKVIDEMVRESAAGHFLGIGCKERALCTWALLRSSGMAATLVVGVDLFPLATHSWCEFDSMILSDFRDRCESFIPILKYG